MKQVKAITCKIRETREYPQSNCNYTGKDPKRKNILNLESDEFESDWQRACEYLE